MLCHTCSPLELHIVHMETLQSLHSIMYSFVEWNGNLGIDPRCLNGTM